MSLPLRMTMFISNKEPLNILSHVSIRYAQSKLVNNRKLRYFKSGVMLGDSDIDYEHVHIMFSVKRGAENETEHVRKLGQRTFVQFSAKVVEIEFDGIKYNEFVRRIGVELITIDSCEIDIDNGKVVLLGKIDSMLNMSSFKIGYPLGQHELIQCK